MNKNLAYQNNITVDIVVHFYCTSCRTCRFPRCAQSNQKYLHLHALGFCMVVSYEYYCLPLLTHNNLGHVVQT